MHATIWFFNNKSQRPFAQTKKIVVARLSGLLTFLTLSREVFLRTYTCYACVGIMFEFSPKELVEGSQLPFCNVPSSKTTNLHNS